MKITRILALSAFAGILALGTASAGQINGSLEIGTLGTAINNGTSIGDTTSLTTTLLISGSAFGDFAIVPFATFFAPATLDLTDFSTFMFSNATYGTFTGASGNIVTQTSSGTCPGITCGGFLDVFILGTYSGLPGFDDSPASFRISYTQTGDAISASGTLASPPAGSVPEPATMALFGSALVGLGLFGRKKLASR